MHVLEIQVESVSDHLPDEASFQRWVDAALFAAKTPFEVVVRLVDELEMTELNQTYRHKTGSTNILSFPFEPPPEVEMNLLGDLVICAPVIEREALEQGKALDAHWAHIVVHGVLHLVGYDHMDEAEAEEMENLEIAILNTLHINNPYKEL
jgi:probable rRNA maturation factor